MDGQTDMHHPYLSLVHKCPIYHKVVHKCSSGGQDRQTYIGGFMHHPLSVPCESRAHVVTHLAIAQVC